MKTSSILVIRKKGRKRRRSMYKTCFKYSVFVVSITKSLHALGCVSGKWEFKKNKKTNKH